VAAGRRRYLDLLIPQLLRERGWDRLQVWVNTADEADLAYIRTLPGLDDRITLIEARDNPPGGRKSLNPFYRACVDPDTVYIRFDDDIVWVEPGLIERLVEFRLANPAAFLVIPVIINNAMISYILQVQGRITVPGIYLRPSAMDEVAWRNPQFAEGLHRHFIGCATKNTLGQLKFPTQPIAVNRVALQCFAWLGSEFARFGGVLPPEVEEEEFLSAIKPTQLGKANLVFGEGIVAHFAAAPQRAHLEQTDLLEAYRELAKL
jgi:hypothetical protein